MAYTAVVTKKTVTQKKSTSSIYNITIEMVVNDGQEDVFTATASEQYNANSPDLAELKQRLIEQLKEQWDKYASEQGVFTAAAFDTMVGQVQTAANTYVNQ